MLHKPNASCPKFKGTGKTSHMETIKVSILILHYSGPAVKIMFHIQVSSGISFVLSIQKGSELPSFFWHEAIRCLEDKVSKC